VVLTVAPDHLGLGGVDTLEQLAYVKGVLVEAVATGGCAVLNAEDALVLAMRERTSADVALFSTRPLHETPPLAQHVRGGGRGASVEADGTLTLHEGSRRVSLADVAELPMTLGGAAHFQVQNAAAAALAGWAGGIAEDVVRRALRSFVPSVGMTPGRMNVVDVRGAKVVVDYAHNPPALVALRDSALRAPARRRLGVVATPGDRSDDAIREFGAVAVGLDRVVFKEHPRYRRGRVPGEISALMLEGFVAAGGDAAVALIARDEDEAVRLLLAMLRPGDRALFVVDDLDTTLAALTDESVQAPAPTL